MLKKLTDEALAARIVAAAQLLAEAQAMQRECPSPAWRKCERNASKALGRLRAEQRRRVKATPTQERT